MKKEYKLILGVLIFTIVMLWLQRPLELYMNHYFTDRTINRLIAKIIDRLFIIIVLFAAVQRVGLSRFNGIKRKIYIRDKWVLFFPVILILLGIWGNWTIYSDADQQTLLLFVVSVSLVGLVEEFCFRGLFLPLLIASNLKKKNPFLLGVVVSSLIFGLLHFFNLFRQPENFWGITSQVFFGIAIGTVFGALMLRTGNIFIVAMFHAFVNFILGHSFTKKESAKKIIQDIPKDGGLDIVSTIGTVIIFCLIFFIGLHMIKKVDKEAIELDLENLKV